ncbi:MAG TPA: hypothetical protein VFP96_09495 [Candidatus Acidoferrum sp.]|nr:hypothetical protein [Candidatus Acidoferrum sp.]
MKPIYGRFTVKLCHCAAFVPSSVSPDLWMPCTEPALRRGLFCAKHRDAIDGAVLGARSIGLLHESSDKRRSAWCRKRARVKKSKDRMRFASQSPRL